MSQIESTKELHNQGEYQQAIQGYQDILAEQPNNDEAHFGLAHASSRLNQLELALKHAKEAVKLVPNSDRYQQFKGQMLLANRQIDEALSAFKRSIKENPNLFYSYLAIGDIYAIKNDHKKAKNNYKLALKVHKDGVPAVVKLSRLLLIEGDYDGAEDLLDQAELQYPEEPELKLQMGIMKLEQGKAGFAELYFKKLIEDEPANHVAKSYLAMSLVQSDPEQASKIITELLNENIRISELMVALGMLHEKNKNHSEAINYLSHINEPGLAYPSWLITLAQALVNNGQQNSATAVLEKVLQRSNNSQALLLLGQIHQTNKDHQTAIKTYRKVRQDSKNYEQSILKQVECLYALGDYAAVVEQLEPLLIERPDHNTAIKIKLNALSQMGEYDQALDVIEAIDSSKQVDQFNQLMHMFAGLILDDQQKYDQAWQHFSVLKPETAEEISLLNAAEEKMVQQFNKQATGPVIKFVFTDASTGHYDFINWILDNNITPLTDRFTNKPRGDVFSQQWSVQMLHELDDAQIHFMRKKYIRQLNQAPNENPQDIVDFIPTSPINLAIISRIFPQAQVLVLSRNFADLRLHDRVFGSQQVQHAQFSKVVNQMVAMNPNVSLVDIDAWQQQEATTLDKIHQIFGPQVTPFLLANPKPLDRLMFPFKHWKNYQQQLNE